MKELSIFVDESGDFGPYSNHSPYYLFALVFHEQKYAIHTEVDILNRKIQEHGFQIHAIHAGPIIRNERYYQNFSPDDRKRLFNTFLLFTNCVDMYTHHFKNHNI